ncbi:MAG: gamma-glutamyl-gamma-aminobutyrate hydrolase family protein [Deltaproteobacteria bacterium]|nr:gamma-glutamyl-gamma-aminobutyrate hydrolase family protein [Deltaproteobacteria bacterium]
MASVASPTSARRARPLVGVTGPDRGGAVAWELTRLALRRVGADAVRITAGNPHHASRIDALVVGGGADIDPSLYGEAPESMSKVVEGSRKAVRAHRTPALSLVLAPGIFLMRKIFEKHTAAGVDSARDALERRLIDDALAKDKPVLGICRGAQILNVCLGGTLHLDVADFYVEKPQLRTMLPRKLVKITEGTRLARVLGAAPCLVNALHHQAVDGLGRDVVVAAREGNGLVQAIEVQSARYAIGVQWHPEYIPQHRRQQALFESLVAYA